MSVRLMGLIWPQLVEPVGRKMVLLAFADAANDDGLTWIAIESQRGSLDLRQKCSLDARSVRRHVSSLEKDGWIERHETAGKGCIWRVHATPDRMSGVKEPTPDKIAQNVSIVSGEPFLNRQETKKTGERLKPVVDKCPVIGRALPPGVSLGQWEAFLDMRASIAKAVKPYVANIVLAKLEAIGKAGWHAGDVLDRSTVNVWPDVFEPEAGRVTGVRRVVAGCAADPVGMSDDDRAELSRIAAIEDTGRMLEARREFMARVERRNAPVSLGQLIGELPLRPPVRGSRRK